MIFLKVIKSCYFKLLLFCTLGSTNKKVNYANRYLAAYSLFHYWSARKEMQLEIFFKLQHKFHWYMIESWSESRGFSFLDASYCHSTQRIRIRIGEGERASGGGSATSVAARYSKTGPLRMRVSSMLLLPTPGWEGRVRRRRSAS